MKTIFLTLVSIIFFLPQINAFATGALQTVHSAEDGKKEPLNISSWSIEDAAMQTTISSVQPSPDGKHVLIESYPPYVDENKPQPTEISLVNTETKEVIWKTPIDGLSITPHWSPDGKNVSFFRINNEGKYILLTTPLHKYEPIEIAQGTWDIVDYFWSPDGKKIALLLSETSSPTADEDYFSVDSQKETKFLSLVSLNFPLKGLLEPKPLSFAKSSFSNLSIKPNTKVSWAPDSENIVFVGVDPESNLEGIFNINASLGEITLIEDKGNPDFPMYSPDGKSIAYVANIEGGSSSEENFPTKKRRIFLKKIGEEGDPQKLSLTFDEQPTLIGWYPDGKHLLVFEGYKTIRRLYKLPIMGGGLEVLNANQDDFISTISLSSSGKDIGFLLESLDTVPRPFTSSIEKFFPERATQEFTKSIPLKSEIIRWKSFDGKEIEGILIYPLSYQPGKSYPLVVVAHDGPYAAWEKRFMGGCYDDTPFAPAVLSAQGYAVFLPNIRGSSNYGIDFAQANQKDLGGGDFKDLMSGVDYLIKRRIADPDKLSIWGWGYGGYLAAWATTQTNRFKTSIVGAGIIDFISCAYTGKKGFLEGYLGSPFWENKKLWLSRSPIMNAKNSKTPTLLQYALSDKFFPDTQGNELYHVLNRNNIPVKMEVFTAEGHKFRHFSLSRKLALTGSLEWLDKHINPISQSKNKMDKK